MRRESANDTTTKSIPDTRIEENEEVGQTTHGFSGRKRLGPGTPVPWSLLRGEAYCFALAGSSAEGRAGAPKQGLTPGRVLCTCGVGLGPLLGVHTSKNVQFGPGYV